MKSLIKKYFSNFAYFYQYLGHRLFISVFLSIVIGLLDGFGLAMFLPLLKMTEENQTMSGGDDGIGKFSFITRTVELTGLPITLTLVLAIMVLFFVLKGVTKYFSGVYRVVLQQFFIKKLRLRMLNSFNKMNFRNFIVADVGRIQNTMSGEVDRVARGFSMYFQTFEQSILMLVYVGFAFFVDVKFATLVTLGGLATNLIYKSFYTLTYKASSQLTSKSNDYQGEIIQHVGNYKYLKATSLLSVYSQKLIKTINQIEYVRKQLGTYGSALQAVREPLLIIIVAIVILVQIKVLGGSLGSILVSLLFFYRSLASLTAMQQSWNKFLETSGSIVNVQLFQKELTESSETYGTKVFEGLRHSLQFDNISVSYGNTNVLSNVSLKILKNESIAFVGESGSGKTTLVNVISGLIQPDTGTFAIDGISRNELDIRTYQRRLGYVTQEPVIFNDTIFNNITAWAEPTDANIKKFFSVVEKASLSEFLNSLPAREHSVLGINGVNISGGQKQRISIARELFKDIDILILDEATSALDTETEKSIQESIEALRGYYTIIIVAHRLSTVKNVDKIALMSKGMLIQIGAFNDLKLNNPIFKKMVDLQEISDF